MEDMEDLLKEADKLGILNIEGGGQLSPEILRIAIDATKQLDSELDDKIIKKKLQKVDQIVAAQHR